MKILEIIVPLGNGGVEQMIKYWVSALIADNVQIDIATPQIVDMKNRDYFEKIGCNIYVIPYRQRHIITRYKKFKYLMQHNKYDVVHIHTNVCLDFVGLAAAKKNKISIRIGHSHATALGNANPWASIINTILKPIFRNLCTAKLACSEKAGRFLFGNNDFQLCKNGINIERFSFSNTFRNQVRNELEINDKIVIGAVANFMPEKNHHLMIAILQALVKKNGSYILLLIGSGILFNEIKKEVERLELSTNVYFLGNRHDVYKYYSAMDSYLLCSHNEGFAVSAIEAQCNGLPFFMGCNLSSEMKITPYAYTVDDFDNPQKWAESIDGVINQIKVDRTICAEQVKSAGYDICESVKTIRKEYRI